MRNEEKLKINSEAILLELQQKFGAEVVKRRLAKGWDQKKFIQMSGIPQATVSAVELGKRNLTMRIMAKFIKELNATFTRFFSGDDFNKLLK